MVIVARRNVVTDVTVNGQSTRFYSLICKDLEEDHERDTPSHLH